MAESTQTTAARLSALDTPASRLCVGIDPHAQTLGDWGLRDSAEGVVEFGARLIDACVTAGISVIKPQVALYERHGVAGMRALAQHIGTARQAGLIVIADAKRGDIGSSLEGYADAWLGTGRDWESDGVTLNPFLGVGALEGAFEVALNYGKAVFVLAATSNPESETLQSARTSFGHSVSQAILHDLHERFERSGASHDWLGAVVGATVDIDARGIEWESSANIPLLAPGFGYQGAQLADLAQQFGSATHRVIPAVSRSVAGSTLEGLDHRIEDHLEELRRVV